MKTRVLTAALMGLLIVGSTVRGQEEKPKLESQQEKACYGIGLNLGKNFARQGLEVSYEALFKGIRDGFKGADPAISDEVIEAALVAMQEAMQKKQAELRKAQIEKNKKEGDAYLAENAKKPGVTVTDSGLQYEVIKAGDGASPKETDVVTTHYHGTLVDGTVFDSSVERKQPAQFPVNRVIPGWTEALQMMKVGDKWRLVIPSELAYGMNPRPGGPIGPNAVLIFEVELLKIGE